VTAGAIQHHFGDKVGIVFIDRMWMGTFWDTPASREHHIAACRFLFRTLNGLAIERTMSPNTFETKTAFALLNMVITQLLSNNKALPKCYKDLFFQGENKGGS